MEKEIGEEDATAIFDIMRFTTALLPSSETLRPLDASNPTPNIGKMYARLPCVFPVANMGDMPGALDLPFKGDCATAYIQYW